MLRWSVLLLGLALGSCALGAGIDPPSADIGDGELGSDGMDGGVSEGAGPPTDNPGSGSGGAPCCSLNLGGSSGSLGGEGP